MLDSRCCISKNTRVHLSVCMCNVCVIVRTTVEYFLLADTLLQVKLVVSSKIRIWTSIMVSVF